MLYTPWASSPSGPNALQLLIRPELRLGEICSLLLAVEEKTEEWVGGVMYNWRMFECFVFCSDVDPVLIVFLLSDCDLNIRGGFGWVLVVREDPGEEEVEKDCGWLVFLVSSEFRLVAFVSS